MVSKLLPILLLLFLALHPRAQTQQVPAQTLPPPTGQASSAVRQASSLDVGDIPFDPALDDPNFHLNDSTRVFQYYNANSWWLDHKSEYRKIFEHAACEIVSKPSTPSNPTVPPNPTTPSNPADPSRTPASSDPAAAQQTQSGWLTIRFIVNTAGETGRFRLFEMDSAYQSFHFDPKLSGCLLATAKSCHWVPAHFHGRSYDTYQYITFHLEQGRIVDITP